MKKRRLKRSSVVTGIVLFLSVIAMVLVHGSVAEPQKIPPETKKPVSTPTAVKTVTLQQAPEYKYNPVGKPDPFRPFVDQEIAEKKRLEKKKETLPISPLQRASVEEFRLVGITGTESSRKAIVQDVHNKFYPIFVGTIIGKNNGRVVEILADRVIVEEMVGVRAGKKMTRRIAMKLRKDEGEEKP